MVYLRLVCIWGRLSLDDISAARCYLAFCVIEGDPEAQPVATRVVTVALFEVGRIAPFFFEPSPAAHVSRAR